MAVVTHLAPERWRIVVWGLVQGVGFRPFVSNDRLGLSGFVRNHANRLVPPNDGGLSLGQAAVAAARLAA